MTRLRIRIPIIAFSLTLWAAHGTVPAAQAQQPETLAAWNQYVRATEDRIESELSGAGSQFFSRDFESAERAAEDMRTVLEGRTIIDKMKTRQPNGSDIDVPGGMIHHWRGAVFIAGVTLDDVLDAVRHPENDAHQEDVLEVSSPGADRRVRPRLPQAGSFKNRHRHIQHRTPCGLPAAWNRPGIQLDHCPQNRRTRGCRYGTRARKSAWARPRLSLATPFLLAIRGSGRRRCRRVRIHYVEPLDPFPGTPLCGAYRQWRRKGIARPDTVGDADEAERQGIGFGPMNRGFGGKQQCEYSL